MGENHGQRHTAKDPWEGHRETHMEIPTERDPWGETHSGESHRETQGVIYRERPPGRVMGRHPWGEPRG